MSKTAVVTARVQPDILASLDRLAIRNDRSRAWLVAQAVSSFVREEERFAAYLQEAEDEIDRGDYLTQEAVEERFLHKDEPAPPS